MRQQNLQRAQNGFDLQLFCGHNFLCSLVLDFTGFGRIPPCVFQCDIYSFPHVNWPSGSPGTADHELIRLGRESVQQGQYQGMTFPPCKEGTGSVAVEECSGEPTQNYFLFASVAPFLSKIKPGPCCKPQGIFFFTA